MISFMQINIKDELSPSKEILLICFNESHLRMIKNPFYFVLKVIFILKLFKFLSLFSAHVKKTA